MAQLFYHLIMYFQFLEHISNICLLKCFHIVLVLICVNRIIKQKLSVIIIERGNYDTLIKRSQMIHNKLHDEYCNGIAFIFAMRGQNYS